MSRSNHARLRDERHGNDSRYLSAEIMDNGDLLFVGLDAGPGVKEIFDATEYEWRWTVKAEDVELLRRSIGGPGDVIALLRRQFSGDNAANLFDFLQTHGIPFDSWSRVGD